MLYYKIDNHFILESRGMYLIHGDNNVYCTIAFGSPDMKPWEYDIQKRKIYKDGFNFYVVYKNTRYYLNDLKVYEMEFLRNHFNNKYS